MQNNMNLSSIAVPMSDQLADAVPANESFLTVADADSIPLVVDLDGSLIKTDLLLECAIRAIRMNVFLLFMFPIWLARGKSTLKAELARRVAIDPGLLPYNQALLSFLRDQREHGRRLILATASYISLVRPIARHLGIFDEVLATEGTRNLAGTRKCDLLLEKYGDKQFDYVGNAIPDLKIWPHARFAFLVNPGTGVESSARRVADVKQVFIDRKA